MIDDAAATPARGWNDVKGGKGISKKEAMWAS